MNALPCWADMAQASHAKQLDQEARLAERCCMEIGSLLADGDWWRDAIGYAPDDIWDRISEAMADDDSAEAGNILMEWGKGYAQKQVETKYGVQLL